MAVMVNHFDHTLLPGGYLGVDVFYVISGFVITQSLMSHPTTSFLPFISGFFARRVRRLLPALLIFVLVTSFAISCFDPSAEPTILTGMAALVGLSNLLLFYKSTDYFGLSSELNAFTHTWSLGVEEQFYLVYPFLFWGLAASLKKSLGRGAFKGLIALFSILSLAGFVILYPNHQPLAYFLMPTRFWELGAGCLLYLSWAQLSSDSSRVWLWLQHVAPWLLVGIFLMPMTHPVAATVAIAFLSGFSIISLTKKGPTAALFGRPLMVQIGQMSYSIYLWHWGVIAISRWTIGIHPWSIPFQVLLIFGLSWMSFTYLEKPFRKLPLRPPVLLGGALLGVLLGLGMTLAVYLKHEALFLGKFEQIDAGIPETFVGPRTGVRASDCLLSRIQREQSTEKRLANMIGHCTTAKNADFGIMVVGDSHALDILPVVDELAYQEGWNFLFTWQYRCHFPALPKDPALCVIPQALIKQRTEQSQKRWVILIRQNLSPRAMTREFNEHITALKAFLETLVGKNVRVVLMAPAPKASMAENGGICYEQPFRPRWAISKACQAKSESVVEQMARRNDYVEALNHLQGSYPFLSIFDPFDTLCARSGDACTLTNGKDFYYRDQSHLTLAGSRALTSGLKSHLEEVIKGP